MKRRRAHHDIEGIFKRKLQKVTSHQAYSRSKLRSEMLASRVQHFWERSTVTCPCGNAPIHSAVRRPVPHRAQLRRPEDATAIATYRRIPLARRRVISLQVIARLMRVHPWKPWPGTFHIAFSAPSRSSRMSSTSSMPTEIRTMPSLMPIALRPFAPNPACVMVAG